MSACWQFLCIHYFVVPVDNYKILGFTKFYCCPKSWYKCIFPITVYCWDIQQINLYHYLWKFYRTISALLCNSKSLHLHVGYMVLETLSIHRLKTSLCHIDVHTTSFFPHGALWVRLKDGKIFFLDNLLKIEYVFPTQSQSWDLVGLIRPYLAINIMWRRLFYKIIDVLFDFMNWVTHRYHDGINGKFQ